MPSQQFTHWKDNADTGQTCPRCGHTTLQLFGPDKGHEELCRNHQCNYHKLPEPQRQPTWRPQGM